MWERKLLKLSFKQNILKSKFFLLHLVNENTLSYLLLIPLNCFPNSMIFFYATYSS